FQPGKSVLAVAVHGEPIHFRDSESGKELFTVQMQSHPWALAFTTDGTGLLAGDPESFGFYYAPARPDGKFSLSGKVHENYVISVAHVSRINQNHCNLTMSASADGSIRLWGSGKEMAVATGDFGPVRSAALGGKSPIVVAGYLDGQVRLWDLALPHPRCLLGVGAPRLALFRA